MLGKGIEGFRHARAYPLTTETIQANSRQTMLDTFKDAQGSWSSFFRDKSDAAPFPVAWLSLEPTCDMALEAARKQCLGFESHAPWYYRPFAREGMVMTNPGGVVKHRFRRPHGQPRPMGEIWFFLFPSFCLPFSFLFISSLPFLLPRFPLLPSAWHALGRARPQLGAPSG